MAARGTHDVRRPRAHVLLLAALACLVTVGCASDPPPRPPPAPTSPPASGSTSPPASGDVSPTRAPNAPATRRGPVRIALAGDVHFEGVLAGRLRSPRAALGPVRQALAEADVTVLNLETSVGTGGRPEPGKRFTFSAGPAAFTALAAAGVDVAVMANNHAVDFGRARLASTLRAARAAASADPALAVVGIGLDADRAFQPAFVEVRGTVVATLAASVADQDPTADRTGQWAATDDRSGIAGALDPTRLLAAVRRADRAADVVVAYLHWGVQGQRCPSTEQRSLATRLVEAGADVVAGSHAHVLQGDGRLGEGYVAYGLGNFAWYSPGTAATARTGVLTLSVRPAQRRADRAEVVGSTWWPGRIGSDGLPSRLAGPAAADFASDREALRSCADLVPRP